MKMHRILVVDDEEAIRDMCKKALEWAGYRVDVCQNAHEALELLSKEEDYELVLTDLNLPGLNGLELISEIKKRYPHCKTLLMTGILPGNDINTENCLRKPFGFTELILEIKQCLSSP